ncbi:hypothetical protein AK830_g788 [Neonectria ditissima]|uniref:Uncharacterized protein n=1 Tax=Neonectria ditissima TaxID=78410 RepID=A0A0P7BXS5_9HYPO|nr:hypothetical protein AK830_g788 [Neonectria ditissima]
MAQRRQPGEPPPANAAVLIISVTSHCLLPLLTVKGLDPQGLAAAGAAADAAMPSLMPPLPAATIMAHRTQQLLYCLRVRLSESWVLRSVGDDTLECRQHQNICRLLNPLHTDSHPTGFSSSFPSNLTHTYTCLHLAAFTCLQSPYTHTRTYARFETDGTGFARPWDEATVPPPPTRQSFCQGFHVEAASFPSPTETEISISPTPTEANYSAFHIPHASRIPDNIRKRFPGYTQVKYSTVSLFRRRPSQDRTTTPPVQQKHQLGLLRCPTP